MSSLPSAAVVLEILAHILSLIVAQNDRTDPGYARRAQRTSNAPRTANQAKPASQAMVPGP